MSQTTRRTFLQTSALTLAASPLAHALRVATPRFQIGIQEYTFNRWIKSGKLDHLDYPALVKKELGL